MEKVCQREKLKDQWLLRLLLLLSSQCVQPVSICHLITLELLHVDIQKHSCKEKEAVKTNKANRQFSKWSVTAVLLFTFWESLLMELQSSSLDWLTHYARRARLLSSPPHNKQKSAAMPVNHKRGLWHSNCILQQWHSKQINTQPKQVSKWDEQIMQDEMLQCTNACYLWAAAVYFCIAKLCFNRPLHHGQPTSCCCKTSCVRTSVAALKRRITTLQTSSVSPGAQRLQRLGGWTGLATQLLFMLLLLLLLSLLLLLLLL